MWLETRKGEGEEGRRRTIGEGPAWVRRIAETTFVGLT